MVNNTPSHIIYKNFFAILFIVRDYISSVNCVLEVPKRN